VRKRYVQRHREKEQTDAGGDAADEIGAPELTIGK